MALTPRLRALVGTLTEDKHNIMFAQCGINYAQLPACHRKGSILLRERHPEQVKELPDGTPVVRPRTRVVILHDDLIGDAFWSAHPELLAPA